MSNRKTNTTFSFVDLKDHNTDSTPKAIKEDSTPKEELVPELAEKTATSQPKNETLSSIVKYWCLNDPNEVVTSELASQVKERAKSVSCNEDEDGQDLEVCVVKVPNPKRNANSIKLACCNCGKVQENRSNHPPHILKLFE